jgi:hypothetical protein
MWSSSLERFCLTPGIEAIGAMMCSNSLARRIIVAEAESATAGAPGRRHAEDWLGS